MIKNKKGLSTIVITVILVALVLVAIAIVWAVVKNLIGEGAENIEISSKCLHTDIQATTVDCSIPTACEITLTRTGTSTDEIAGVKLVFKNAAGDSSNVLSEVGNIEALAGTTVTKDSGISIPTSVGVTVYFVDSLGKEQLCTNTKTTNF